MNKLKKVSFIALIIGACLLSSCSIADYLDDKYFKDTEDISTEKNGIIRKNTVLEPSKADLKSMFCNSIQNLSTLDTEIDNLFTFLDLYSEHNGDGKDEFSSCNDNLVVKETDN